jgi:hypothetical protein
VRNDHLYAADGCDELKWIDFDLEQDFGDYDVWSAGNVIAFCVGKDVITFEDARRIDPDGAALLCEDDASLFFPNRVMNLARVFPWVPQRLNRVLMRFSTGSREYYESIGDIVRDLDGVLNEIA